MTENSQIEQIVDEFDEAWFRGESPSLRAFVKLVPKQSRLQLFRLLLPIDIECRCKGGEEVAASDYRSVRFCGRKTSG